MGARYIPNGNAELGLLPLIINAYERFGLTYNGVSRNEFLPLTAAKGKSSKDIICTGINQLRKYPYWRPGSALITPPVICVDIDSRHAVNEGLIRMKAAGLDIMPSAIILNTRKGTAQFQWFLDDIYCHVGRNNAQSIHNDPEHTTMFREVKRSLSMILHGDILFMHERMRNPYHDSSSQRVMLLDGAPRHYRLDDIDKAITSIHAKITDESVVGKYNMKSWIAKQSFNERRQQGEIEDNRNLEPSDFAPNHIIPIGKRNREAYNSMFAAAMHHIDPASVIGLMRFEGTFTGSEKHALVKNVRKAANRKLRLYGEQPVRHDETDDDIITETYDSMHRSNMMSRKCKSPTTSRIASEYGRIGASEPTEKQISTRTSNLRRGSRIGTIKHAILRSEVIHTLNGDNAIIPKTDRQLRKTIARMHGITTYSDEECRYRYAAIRNARREITKLASTWIINTMHGYDSRRIKRIIARKGAIRGAASIIRLAASTGFITTMNNKGILSSNDMTMNMGLHELTIDETSRTLNKNMPSMKDDDAEWENEASMPDFIMDAHMHSSSRAPDITV